MESTPSTILSPWDYENGFYHSCDPSRMAKLIAHYELYKMIVNLPGNVVELGVYKAASFIRFCAFREMLESPYSRRIIGFDAFGKFPVPAGANAADSNFIAYFEKEGGKGLSKESISRLLERKNFSGFELIEGDIAETVPQYLEAHPELRVALLHIDVDVYAPSKLALEAFYDRIVPGGLIVLDDYAIVAGETTAVDEFFQGKDFVLQKLPFSHRPAFIVKK